jgi:hypothetical protein
VIAFPLFFASVLAVSLAIERPHRFQWRGRNGNLIEIDHPPTAATEVKIWALALVVPLLLVLVGLAASFWRRGGLYVVSAAGIAAALALPVRLDRWSTHHAKRFPYGMDLFKDTTPSSTIARGEWERSARETVLSLTHYALGLAVAAALIGAALAYRRSRARVAPPPPPPPPEAALVGAPEVAPSAGVDSRP